MFLVEIPLPNLLTGNVSLEILSYIFIQIFFGSDFSSRISWYFFSSVFFGKNYFFEVCLADDYSSEILGIYRFLCRDFLAMISLQKIFGKYLSLRSYCFF